ncbi:hypothetical protein [Lacrimispora sp.]|uniref:hypothetical protein n=1 Tax=Lacrimispora sp. TaxID=2719234 RepID=UPI0034605A63
MRGEIHASALNDGYGNSLNLAKGLALGCFSVGNICFDYYKEVSIMGYGHVSGTLDRLEHLPVEVLAAAVSVGDLKSLLINDGRIAGVEGEEVKQHDAIRE